MNGQGMTEVREAEKVRSFLWIEFYHNNKPARKVLTIGDVCRASTQGLLRHGRDISRRLFEKTFTADC